MGLIKRILFKRVPLPIFIISIIIGTYFIKYTYLYLFVYPSYKTSYIQKISSKYYSNDQLKLILDDFNKLGYNKIIKYKGTRPIVITDGTIKRPTLGRAWDSISWGFIELGPKLSPPELRLVLIHELLHVYGYDHTQIDGDLMYPYLDKLEPPSETNIKEWAVKLCVFLNNKNECK